jgi:hypothetical protein
MRHREPKLQRLLERASTRPRRPKGASSQLLATKAGQVDRSCRRTTGEAVATLEEEDGATCVQAHQIPFPLTIEAGRKRRRKRGRHSRRSTGTAHMCRRRTPAASRSARRPASAATPLTTKAGRRTEREDGAEGAREQQAARKLLEGVVVASSTLSSD